MNKLLKIIDKETKQPWTVKILTTGDAYGRDNCLTHDEDKPLVEFYDGRYIENFGPEGQFVSRYYVETILEGNAGLNLDGGIASWSINFAAMDDVREFLAAAVAVKNCKHCGSTLGLDCGEAEADYNEDFCSVGCYEVTSKLDFEVMIRPRVADCSHSDVIVVPAYDVEDAFERTAKLLKNGAHVPDLGKSVDYIVKGVISPGDELYGLDETCDCGRASAYIGCSYII